MSPSHAGIVLPEHYATREAVEALLALGDLSALGCSLAECEAYCRDRARNSTNPRTRPDCHGRQSVAVARARTAARASSVASAISRAGAGAACPIAGRQIGER